MSEPIFRPKLLTSLRDYSWQLWWGDLTSGVIVGIVALPLAIAFAIASGVTPDRGLTTAIIAGVLISALGGSRVQIGGPTGAFVVIVYGVVEQFGVNGLILATLLAGIMLVGMGALRLGAIIRFIPYPLTVGFTAGIAIVIFSSQIRDFFGLQTGTLPADFVLKWRLYFHTLHTIDLETTLLAVGALLTLIYWPRVSRKVPGSIVVIVGGTLLAHWLHLSVETIGSRFGEIPHGLPTPHWPTWSMGQLKVLVGPAFTIAILGAIESLLSATVADSMIEGRHRSNTELIGQGIANLLTPLFGGIPATGAIARTATNVRNGGKTPIAGIVHAATLLVIVLLFGRYAQLIPLCILAAILVMVAYHMSEWHAVKALLRAPRTDISVMLVTLLLTVFVDLTAAVEVGMVMALVLFMKRMTDVTSVREVTGELGRPSSERQLRAEPDAVSQHQIPPGVVVYEAEGAFFFGVASQLRDLLQFGAVPPKVLILRMRHVLALDASGLRALSDLQRSCARNKITLILEGIHAQPLFTLVQSGQMPHFGSDNVVPGLTAALRRAQALLSA